MCESWDSVGLQSLGRATVIDPFMAGIGVGGVYSGIPGRYVRGVNTAAAWGSEHAIQTGERHIVSSNQFNSLYSAIFLRSMIFKKRTLPLQA